MRLLLQRVTQSSVAVDRIIVGQIGVGLLVFVGVLADDTDADIDWLVRKTLQLRIFPDEEGVMNRSLKDISGDVLVVSQFTLHASTQKGNRPSYSAAAPPLIAQPLYERFVRAMSAELGKAVATGIFGADMQVALINDGPITLWLDSRRKE